MRTRVAPQSELEEPRLTVGGNVRFGSEADAREGQLSAKSGHWQEVISIG